MKKILLLATFTAICLSSLNTFAAETSVKGTIYANWMMDLSKGTKNYNAFTIDRAYFGAESKLSDYTSMKITFDIRPDRFTTAATKVIDSNGDTVSIPSLAAYNGYPIILKYAYADWKVKPIAQYLKIRLGLQPTAYLDYMSNTWLRRYIAKNIIDEKEWLSTADLGASFISSLGPQGKLGEVGVSILNGTKYSDFIDKNKNKDLDLFAKIIPFYNNGDFDQVTLFAQFYTGTQNKAVVDPVKAADWKRQIMSIGGKLAYQKWVDVCFDANFQTLGQGPGVDAMKQRALSFWGDLYLSGVLPPTSLFKTLALFGRFDSYDPNTKVDKDGNSLLIAGLECSPVKGVRGAVGFKQTSYQQDNKDPLKSLFINAEFKF